MTTDATQGTQEKKMKRETRDKISKAQRERYERERKGRHDIRSELHRFALWNSPIWDEDSEDDVESALRRVDAFLAGEESDH